MFFKRGHFFVPKRDFLGALLCVTFGVICCLRRTPMMYNLQYFHNHRRALFAWLAVQITERARNFAEKGNDILEGSGEQDAFENVEFAFAKNESLL